MKRWFSAAVCVVLMAFVSSGYCEDWPQFRGINRDGKSPETGLLKTWPAGGPRLLWACEELGDGFGSLSIAGGAVYTTGLAGAQGLVYAVDLDGKLKWKKEYGPDWSGDRPGTRTTPTYEDGKLYLVSGKGKIFCLDAATGDEKWSLDAVGRFRGKIPNWGIAESPLIVGNKVLCTPGGPEASVIALDKKTGKVLWTTKGLSEGSSYCSPILVPAGRSPIVVTMLVNLVVGIAPETGKVLWQQVHRTRVPVHAVSPVYDNGYLYVTSGYGSGGDMFKLSADGREITKLWSDKNLDCHHGGVVALDGCIYGSSSNGNWVCLSEQDGQMTFKDRGVGKGSIIGADGMLYCFGENGTMGLVKASPQKYDLVSSFKITKGSREAWAHPAISNGILYLRRGNALMAYDIKQK